MFYFMLEKLFKWLDCFSKRISNTSCLTATLRNGAQNGHDDGSTTVTLFFHTDADTWNIRCWSNTPPKFNSSPLKNCWLEDDPFLLGPGNFSGAMPLPSTETGIPPWHFSPPAKRQVVASLGPASWSEDSGDWGGVRVWWYDMAADFLFIQFKVNNQFTQLYHNLVVWSPFGLLI